MRRISTTRTDLREPVRKRRPERLPVIPWALTGPGRRVRLLDVQRDPTAGKAAVPHERRQPAVILMDERERRNQHGIGSCNGYLDRSPDGVVVVGPFVLVIQERQPNRARADVGASELVFATS